MRPISDIACPVCDDAQLTAPGVCSSCGPIRLFEVYQPRVIRAVYTRQLWARDAAQAIAIAELGTAWPQSYDESRESVECGEYTAEDVTDGPKAYLRDKGGLPGLDGDE